ncbi:MAG: hypothetical protein ACP5OA_07480 [Candidatus Woesearchaeota archaeon]
MFYLNKRGDITFKQFVKIVIAVVVVLVVIGIVRNSLNDSSSTLYKLLEKYVPAKLNSTAFLYSAESISIDDVDAVGCVNDPAGSESFTCPANAPISFIVNLHNGGSKMLRLTGGTVVCEVECNRRGTKCTLPDDCGESITTSGSAGHYVEGGNTVECDAGSYTFEGGKAYRVFAAAKCPLDATYGCSAPGMTRADEYYNSEKYLTISIN